jgi:hypothetical protein
MALIGYYLARSTKGDNKQQAVIALDSSNMVIGLLLTRSRGLTDLEW